MKNLSGPKIWNTPSSLWFEQSPPPDLTNKTAILFFFYLFGQNIWVPVVLGGPQSKSKAKSFFNLRACPPTPRFLFFNRSFLYKFFHWCGFMCIAWLVQKHLCFWGNLGGVFLFAPKRYKALSFFFLSYIIRFVLWSCGQERNDE